MTERIELLRDKVLELYKYLDQDQKNLIACTAGCRVCCDTEAFNIEATVLEFLPLATHLIKTNQLEWIDLIERATDEDRCILFQPNAELKPEGGCLFHEFRPLVCRLFGASFTLRKNQRQILACGPLHERIQGFVDLLPNAEQYRTKLLSIDFFLSRDIYGINTALRKAIEYVGLYYSPKYPTLETKSA